MLRDGKRLFSLAEHFDNFLLFTLLQTGMWENFVEATEEKPWLWVVAIACIFVPIVLLVYFCTSSSKVRAHCNNS